MCNTISELFTKQNFRLVAINPFPNKPIVFMCLQYKSFENPAGKGEIARKTSNFSFFHSVFYPFGKLSAILIKFKNCRLQLFQFRRVKNLSFGKKLIIFAEDNLHVANYI